jgi:hypothetical protein
MGSILPYAYERADDIGRKLANLSMKMEQQFDKLKSFGVVNYWDQPVISYRVLEHVKTFYLNSGTVNEETLYKVKEKLDRIERALNPEGEDISPGPRPKWPTRAMLREEHHPQWYGYPSEKTLTELRAPHPNDSVRFGEPLKFKYDPSRFWE